jgi:hypothetical protein
MSTNNSTENISEPWSTPANLPENDKIIWDYIASRSYRLKYWKILRDALADGTYNQYNLNSVFAGDLEFEVVRVKNKLPGYYQDYNMEFLENLAGVSMCWRPLGVPFIHKPPTDDEIVDAVANAMKLKACQMSVDN